jgi:hypothetical protein
MPDQNKKTMEVPTDLLVSMQEAMANLEKQNADLAAKVAGIEEVNSKASNDSAPKLREKKDFSPKFRTVKIRKYPIAGDFENLGYVIGWTERGAYQTVDRSGITPQIVDMIDVIFLGKEKSKPEPVSVLNLLNKAVSVHCKILDEKKASRKEPTGEEMNVRTYDPQHGLIDSGDTVDGYTEFVDTMYTIQIPGVAEPVVISNKFLS